MPSKSIPKTPLELWNGRKPSLRHYRIWGCPAQVLKKKAGKLESKTEVSLLDTQKGQEEVYSIVQREEGVRVDARHFS